MKISEMNNCIEEMRKCYNFKDDETEIVIRILSFSQMVKVVEPNSFIDLIKDRLLKQKSCGL